MIFPILDGRNDAFLHGFSECPNGTFHCIEEGTESKAGWSSGEIQWGRFGDRLVKVNT